MPIDIQARLLRVLQFGEFSRVGGREVIKTNVNILSKQLSDKLSIEGNSISKNTLDELRLSLSRLDENLINAKELIDVLHIDLKTNEAKLKKINIVLLVHNQRTLKKDAFVIISFDSQNFQQKY